MLENHWRGGKQEKLRLYWKVREERKQGVREKYERLKPHLEERGKRLWAANEALSFGRGGVRAIAEALEMSPMTLLQGKRELQGERGPDDGVVGGRQRRPGGGRKSAQEKHPSLLPALERIVDPATPGGSYGSSEVDVEELEPHCERAEPARLYAQCHHREQVTARGVGIQLASFAQDPRGRLSSGSG